MIPCPNERQNSVTEMAEIPQKVNMSAINKHSLNERPLGNMSALPTSTAPGSTVITPARRLAARQTLKLAIPKLQNLNANLAARQAQQLTAPPVSNGTVRSASPLESLGTGKLSIGSGGSRTGNLSSADLKNNNDIFEFKKELSPQEKLGKKYFQTFFDIFSFV